jgi:phosphatidylserine/phosphatidylglycerophosphate/cardiolipin synthase-like enzyme
VHFRRIALLLLGFSVAVTGLATSQPIAANSVEPFRDGTPGFGKIADLISSADEFVHVLAWGVDNEMSWKPTGPRPLINSRTDPNPPPGSTSSENLNCAKAADAYSLIVILRCKAADLTAKAQARLKGKASWNTAMGEVMVLVWRQTLDDNQYEYTLNNMGDIGYLKVPQKDLLAWTPPVLNAQMQSRGSGASDELLEDFQQYYSGLNARGLLRGSDVVMPTGVQIMTQMNYFDGKHWPHYSSQHQKLVITDKGAFVGGLNAFKEYSDTDKHLQNDPARWASSVDSFTGPDPAPLSFIPPPLHDTGSIVRGTIVSDIERTFDERWLTNTNPATSDWALDGSDHSTPFFPVKRALWAQVRKAGTSGPNRRFLFAQTRGLILQIEGVEATIDKNKPHAVPVMKIDAKYASTNVVFAVSHPTNSYTSNDPPDGIRKEYQKDIDAMAVGDFGYFETQYFQDHQVAEHIFAACNPKPNPHWCNADPFVHIVIPYVPGGSGVTWIDWLKVRPEIVDDEMQNLVWLEVKSAKSIYHRQTGKPWRYIVPKHPPCTPSDPQIWFIDPAVDKDPSKVKLSSKINILGNDPNKPCPNHPGEYVQDAAPIVVKVRDMITTGAIMGYTLANPAKASGGTMPPVPAGSDAYNRFLVQNQIYIHSKHSEFFHAGSLAIYTVGSANLNTRSLGNVASQTDRGNDSESNIFWIPNGHDVYWNEIWGEHMQQNLLTAPLGAAIQGWEDQGFKNYEAILAGKAITGRVVRLDSVERCIRQSTLVTGC